MDLSLLNMGVTNDLLAFFIALDSEYRDGVELMRPKNLNKKIKVK